jgi:hopanoid biosynthesis associated protein HpnK
MAKRLIVNADDFGYTSGINRAVIECAQRGVLTSATLMACADASSEAAQLARQHRLATGCHVILVDGEPLLSDLPTLAPQGRFRASIYQIARHASLRRIAEEEVEREAYAQILRVQEAGVALTHVDTHKHAHMFPRILRPLLRAAKQAGIRRVRNPFEPAWSLSLPHRLASKHRTRTLQTRALSTLHKRFLSAVKGAGFCAPDGALGVITTGTLDVQLLCHMLERIPEGTWELVCHPGYHDEELASQNTRLLHSRDIEREALTSPVVQEMVRRCGIQLISFADL